MNAPSFGVLDPATTVQRLPYLALADEIARLLQDPGVNVLPRLVQALPGGGSLFVMPAFDARLAITKLITFTPANALQAHTARAKVLPTIQGDVVVFDVATGLRCGLLDGPTVTARRTAAVSLLAAQRLAPVRQGPLLIVGAGVQGRAHLDAFADAFPLEQVFVNSRSAASAERLVAHAQLRGLRAQGVVDPNTVAADCPLIVTCTPAAAVVLHQTLRPGQFLTAVGAFTPRMVELSAPLCQQVLADGHIVLDTPDAAHEAGDLLQAGMSPASLAALHSLRDAVTGQLSFTVERHASAAPVLFKSCGWAGWDLAAARLAARFNPAPSNQL